MYCCIYVVFVDVVLSFCVLLFVCCVNVLHAMCMLYVFIVFCLASLIFVCVCCF